MMTRGSHNGRGKSETSSNSSDCVICRFNVDTSVIKLSLSYIWPIMDAFLIISSEQYSWDSMVG